MERIVETVQKRLAQGIQTALNLEFPQAHFEIRLAKLDTPDVFCPRLFESHLDSLWFLLPMSLLRPLFLKHFHRCLSWSVVVNLSRFGTEWGDKIARGIHAMAADTKRLILDELATVEALLDQSHTDTSRIESALGQIETDRKLLDFHFVPHTPPASYSKQSTL